jgi:hypothetical protein
MMPTCCSFLTIHIATAQRVGIVKRLGGYRWSSYKVYAYGRNPPK